MRDLRWMLTRCLAVGATLMLVPLGAASCAATPEDEIDPDGPEPNGAVESGVSFDTVAKAVSGSCTTSSVKGLSLQIIQQGQCIEPDAYAAVPSVANLSIGENVFPYLEAPARDALVKALKANPSKTLTVNSMLRTIAQQYLLYRWYVNGSCGIGLAAKPGNSNHETGLAMDVNEYSSWKSALSSVGFEWFGSSDKVHFDYRGAGSVNYKGTDVQAFQHLWNLNHPEDKISEDGDWGPQTEARMKKAPAGGFAIGPDCGAAPDPDPQPDPQPQPQDCGAYSSTAYQCSPDGASRGLCDGGSLKTESCANGCLIKDSADDVCMGTTSSWSCSGTWGTKKADNGNYYATSFGCWKDSSGNVHQDPGDNCIPACLAKAQNSGLCAGLSGPACEEKVNWFVADAGRFGCLARVKVTNPKNGKSIIAVALDYGPNCSVESQVSHAALDMSYPSTNYLFGSQQGIVDKSSVHVVEVDPSTPLGPVE